MGKQANPYPLRIDSDVMQKAKFIANENGRSLNKEIEFLLKKNIAEYEAEFGQISNE